MPISPNEIVWDDDPNEIQWDDEPASFDLEESITGEPTEIKQAKTPQKQSEDLMTQLLGTDKQPEVGLYKDFLVPTIAAIPRVVGAIAGGVKEFEGSGFGGIAGVAGDPGATPEDPFAEPKAGSMEAGGRVIEAMSGHVAKALLQTPAQQEAIETLMWPIEKLKEASLLFGDTLQKTVTGIGPTPETPFAETRKGEGIPELGAVAATAFEGMAFFYGMPKAMKWAKKVQKAAKQKGIDGVYLELKDKRVKEAAEAYEASKKGEPLLKPDLTPVKSTVPGKPDIKVQDRGAPIIPPEFVEPTPKPLRPDQKAALEKKALPKAKPSPLLKPDTTPVKSKRVPTVEERLGKRPPTAEQALRAKLKKIEEKPATLPKKADVALEGKVAVPEPPVKPKAVPKPEAKAAVAPEATTKGKVEPWEKTLDEFIIKKTEPKTASERSTRDLAVELHKKSVNRAIAEGKIKSHPDYPELTAKKPPTKGVTLGFGPTDALQKLYERAVKKPKAKEAPTEIGDIVKESVDKNKPSIVPVIDSHRAEFLQAVKGNKLDESAIEYLKTNDYDAYLESMPDIGDLKPGEIFRVDPDSQKLIATMPGKKTAAVRMSGYHVVKQFLDAFKKPEGLTKKQDLSWAKNNDLSKRDLAWTDPTRMIQKLDKGIFNGPAQKHILHPTRSTTLAKLQWADTQKMKIAGIHEKYDISGTKQYEAIGDVLESVPFEKSLDSVSDLMKNPEIKKAVAKFKPEKQEQIVGAARDFREFFDSLINDQNSARIKRKQKPIKYRGSYRPHIMKANLWSKLMGLKRKPEHIMDSPEMPDFIKPNQPFNPHALAREGGLKGYELERNITKLASDYVETASKDIFDTNIVHQNKIHAAVLRGLGLENAADAIDVWTAESYAGVAPRLTRWAKGAFPEPLHRGALKLRRNLTRAVFPLNWTWNMFIQTSSAGLTYARYGNRASVAGLKYFTDPVLKKAVRENTYSSIIKQRWGGSAAYQDLSSSLLKMKKLDATRIERVEHYANFLTRAVEDALTGHAVAAAYSKGKRLGFKGRALWEYASEGGAKTQSMYNIQDAPGLLRAREVGAVAPFQTFAFEIFNTVREMNLPGIRKITGKAGAYETIAANTAEGKALVSNRLKMLARWTAAIVVTNAVVDRAINRKPWQISSFIPFYGFISGQYGQGMPMPTRFVAEFKQGVKDVVSHGSWKRLRGWVIKYQMLGGTQINRTIEGIEAVAEGGKKDVSGRQLFPIKSDAEKLRALTMGPFRTKAGAEFVTKRRESQSLTHKLLTPKPKKRSKPIGG